MREQSEIRHGMPAVILHPLLQNGDKLSEGCEMLLDSKMQDLGCNYLQLDEVWGFIGKKERALLSG